jgi:hypothetical protein
MESDSVFYLARAQCAAVELYRTVTRTTRAAPKSPVTAL